MHHIMWMAFICYSYRCYEEMAEIAIHLSLFFLSVRGIHSNRVLRLAAHVQLSAWIGMPVFQ